MHRMRTRARGVVQHGFGMASSRMRREADLFYEELTGTRVRARRWAPSAAPAAGIGQLLHEQVVPVAPAAPQPYLPAGGRAFVPQPGAFNCAPAGFTVVPASFLPEPTADAGAAIDAALGAAGLDAAQRRRISRPGLEPIAAALGASALGELFARLRWSPSDIVDWGRGARSMLVPRLLIHVVGHFRELARRAPTAVEAFVLECLGWAMMSSLRDDVANATGDRWWIPPPPAFVTPVPNPIPAVSREVSRLVLRLGFIDTTLAAGQWNGRFHAWRTGLPGRQWDAEISAAQPGLPFYASLVAVPAHVNTAASRAAIAAGWAQRLADTDARFPPLAAGAAAVTLAGLRNAGALRRCDNSDPHLPAGAIADLPLQGLELTYDFPVVVGRRTIQDLPLLGVLHPVYTELFRAIKELGWNDLMYQTSGAACFRGIKHAASARVTDGGVQVVVNPFDGPNADTVRRINTLFTAAQRARVVAAARTARTMSEHGLGAAIDLDYYENVNSVATRPFGSMDPRLVAIFEAFHFRWGGCFGTTDPMHFEYCRAACAPAPPAAPPGPPAGPLPGMIPPGAGPQLA